MLSVIVILDQVVWRPVIAWSQKFRFEQVESSERRHSPVLHFLQRSRALSLVSRRLTRPLSERVILFFAGRQDAQPSRMRKVHIMTWTFRASATLAMVGVLLAVVAAFRLLAGVEAGWAWVRWFFCCSACNGMRPAAPPFRQPSRTTRAATRSSPVLRSRSDPRVHVRQCKQSRSPHHHGPRRCGQLCFPSSTHGITHQVSSASLCSSRSYSGTLRT
jgi:hypothetical protein